MKRIMEQKNRVLHTWWLGRSCGGKIISTTKPMRLLDSCWAGVVEALYRAIVRGSDFK